MMDVHWASCGNHFMIYGSQIIMHLKLRQHCMSTISQSNLKKKIGYQDCNYKGNMPFNSNSLGYQDRSTMF